VKRSWVIYIFSAFLLASATASLAGSRVAGAQRLEPSGDQFIADESDAPISYLFFAEGTRSINVIGSTDDLDRARALRHGLEGMLYVRRGARSYVIRDLEALRRAQAILAPGDELVARQTALTAQQTTLAKRQDELAQAQNRLSRLQSQASSSDSRDLAREQDTLGQEIDVIGRVEDSLGRGVSSLGREQALFTQEARVKLRRLLADTLRQGAASRID
jgi:hypothetical protein